jgi:hypothetical protein
MIASKKLFTWFFCFFLYPPQTKFGGGGYIVITLSVCPSVQLILSRIGGVMYLVNATPPKRLIGVL